MDFVRSHLGKMQLWPVEHFWLTFFQIWKKSEPKVFNWSELRLSDVTSYKIHILVEISLFSLNSVTFRLDYFRPKLLTKPTKIEHIFRKESISKIKVGLLVPCNILQRKKLKVSLNFPHWKITLKIRILRCSRRLLIM